MPANSLGAAVAVAAVDVGLLGTEAPGMGGGEALHESDALLVLADGVAVERKLGGATDPDR